MREIVLNGLSKSFKGEDFPMLIHGKEGSGASLFSIITAALLCRAEQPVLFWSAYSAAKEELSKELNGNIPKNIYIILEGIEDTSPFKEAIETSDPRTIIFAKNCELLPRDIVSRIITCDSFVLSGDFEKLIGVDIDLFKTKIFFSPLFITGGIQIPILEKYEGYLFGANSGIITIKECPKT